MDQTFPGLIGVKGSGIDIDIEFSQFLCSNWDFSEHEDSYIKIRTRVRPETDCLARNRNRIPVPVNWNWNGF